MEPAPGPKYVVPNPRILSTLGALNIAFASCLLVCGLCNSAYFAIVVPNIGKVMVQAQKKMQDQQDAKKRTELENLAEEAKAAKTDEEKSRIEARRTEVETRPQVKLPVSMDLQKTGLSDPVLIHYVWIDFATGTLLNLVMLVSGIGMIMRKPWGLKSGVVVAVLKIIRLFVCYGYLAISVVPKASISMAKMATEIIADSQKTTGAAVPPGMYDTLVRTYSIMGTVCAVGVIILGVIYPAICLWFLTRPAARAACSDRFKPPVPGELP